MNITRQDLVEMINEKMNMVDKELISKIIESLFDIIIEEMRKGYKIEFRNFGRFYTNIRKARIGHNPKTLIKVQVPSKTIPVFKIGRQFKEQIIKEGERKSKMQFKLPINPVKK